MSNFSPLKRRALFLVSLLTLVAVLGVVQFTHQPHSGRSLLVNGLRGLLELNGIANYQPSTQAKVAYPVMFGVLVSLKDVQATLFQTSLSKGQTEADILPKVLVGRQVVQKGDAASLTASVVNSATWTASSISYTVSASDIATVTGALTPTIAVSPTDLVSAQGTNTVLTQALTINNIGTGALTWQVYEGQLMAQPVKPQHSTTSPTRAGQVRLSTNPDLTQTAFGGQQRLNPTGSYTLTHSVSQNIASGNSASCSSGGSHDTTSYLRVFDLPTFSINNAFNVTSVEIGVEAATGGSGSQPVTVNLYTLSGAFVFANLTPIGSATVSVTDQALTLLNIPVTGTAPAGAKLVVELFTPDGTSGGNSFIIGSNNLGQTDPSYLAAATCGFTEPIDTADIGFPDMHIVMNVYRDLACTGDLSWLTLSPLTGTTSASGSSLVNTVFDSTGLASGVYTGTVCILSNDPVNTQVQIPVTMTVVTTSTSGVQLTPATQTLTGTAGSVVTYTLTVTNTGNMNDTYMIAVSGNTFTTTAPASASLAPGASTIFDVVVTVGTSGSDTAIITLTSQSNGTATANATVTTIVAVTDYKLYLPIIRR